MSSTPLPKILALIGVGFLLVAALLHVFPGIFSRLGRLPGDIRVEGDGYGLYFPWVTCLVISLILSLLAWVFRAPH